MIWFFKSDSGTRQDETKVDALLRRGSECEPGEAEECYRQALSLRPEHAEALASAGISGLGFELENPREILLNIPDQYAATCFWDNRQDRRLNAVDWAVGFVAGCSLRAGTWRRLLCAYRVLGRGRAGS